MRRRPSCGVLAALDNTIAVVPALWPFEVANVLALAERHQRITRKASQSRQCYPLPASDGSVGTMRPISNLRDESACTWPHWITIYRKRAVPSVCPFCRSYNSYRDGVGSRRQPFGLRGES